MKQKILDRYIKPTIKFFAGVIEDIGKSINTLYTDLSKILVFLYSPIVFIAGVGKYISNGVKKYSNDKPLKTIGSKIKRIITNILRDLFKIIKFLYSPIIIVASIGNKIVENINKHFKNSQNNHIKRLNLFLTSKRSEWFPSKARRRFERLKRRLFFAKNETFLNSNIYRIVFMATFGLQCISFFTTFRGSLTFFEGIHWSAPLIFTSVLQTLLIVLANIAFSKRRRFWGRKVMVCILCFISIFLSYVGIANSVIQPSNVYENQYKNFEKSYINVYDLIETKTIADKFDSQIESIFENIKLAKQNADVEIERLNNVVKENKNIPKYIFQKNEEGKYINSYNPDYKDAQEKASEAQKLINVIKPLSDSNIMSSIDAIEKSVKNIDTSSLKNASNYSEAVKELQKNNQAVFNDYKNLVDKYNALIGLDEIKISDMENKISDDLLELIGSEAIALNIDGLKLKNFNDLSDEAINKANALDINKPDKAKILYDFLLQGTDRPQYINYLYSGLKAEADNKFNRIQTAVTNLSSNTQIKEAFDDLDKTYHDDFKLKEPYTFAISHLYNIKGGYFFKTCLMMFFAIIVDGLTVLIPLLCEKRRESALFTKSSDDLLYEQEDVLENLILSCAFPNSEDGKDFNEIIYDEALYYDMLNILSEYIKLYEPSPFTIELGFPKRAKSNLLLPNNKDKKEEKDDSENTTLYGELTAFLMQMGYVKFVSEKEYYLLKCDYYNVEPSGDVKSCKKDMVRTDDQLENGYFLLKANFILWLNDNRLAWLGKKQKKQKPQEKEKC